ncbi:MAG: Hpt domain-containing protein [Xanthomonadales bacterium]|nr:hypothetical protein [Xanthomonadales bacterium]MCC6592950.1 Hpt domain-containing protein [Xanthomonadales bacterium]MCE7929920.1 hypothetical protein [Xanthomonadales bacterium PRO6]
MSRTPPPEPRARLDPARVAAVLALGPSRWRPLLELYRAHSARLLAAYADARAHQDAAAALAPIHQLRAASGSIGALELADTCRRIEAALRGGNWPAPELEEPLANLVAQADAAVAAWLDGRAG